MIRDSVSKPASSMRFKYIYHVLFATSLSLSYVITPESTNGGNIDVYETSNIQQDSLGSLSSPNDQSNSIGQTSQSSDLVATGQFDGLNPVGQPDVPGDLSPPTDQPSTTGQNSQISDLLVASEFNGLNSVDQPDESGSVNQPDESSITTQAEDSDDIPYLYSGPLETIQVWDGISGGLRELSYHTTPDGSAIINGDIVWGPESDLLAQAVDSDANSPLNTRAFSIPAHSGWPNAEIKYKYDSDDGEAIMSNSINAAIAAWLNGAPYLKFTQVHPNSAEPAEAILTIYTGVCAGQSCYVGYKHKPKMQMQRDCTDRTKSWGRAALEGIIHEFGHSLGEPTPPHQKNPFTWKNPRHVLTSPPDRPAARTPATRPKPIRPLPMRERQPDLQHHAAGHQLLRTRRAQRVLSIQARLRHRARRGLRGALRFPLHHALHRQHVRLQGQNDPRVPGPRGNGPAETSARPVEDGF